MGFLEHFRKSKYHNYNFTKIVEDKDLVKFLKQEMFNIMINKDVTWNKNWIKNKNKNNLNYLPAHLNNTQEDIDWIKNLLHEEMLYDKDIYVSPEKIENFLRTNKTYGTYKYLYQLKVVRSLIEYMMAGGRGYKKAPQEYSNYIANSDYVKYFRQSLIATLKELGFDDNIIENGIEKYSDLWLEPTLIKTFKQKYEPLNENGVPMICADKKHMDNWLALEKHNYYEEHKNSVNKYGNPKKLNLKISPEKLQALKERVEKQNDERLEFIINCARSETINNYPF